MAGINHLKEIYDKRGKAFLDNLLNSYVIINEKVNGTFFGIKKSKNDEFKYFKKSGEITYIDRVLMKFYNPAITFFNNLPLEKRQRIPANFFFGFEFITSADNKERARLDISKNNLVLSYIQRLDAEGKVVETVQNRDTLTRWAEYLDVAPPPIVFEGHLDDEQKAQILEFVYSPEKELEDKFKTTSFSKYITTTLNPDFNLEERDIDTLIFRFYGESEEGKEESTFLAKLVDPIFKDVKRPEAKETTNSQDYVWLIVIDLMNHIETYDLDDLREILDDSSFDENYVKLINKIFKDFLVEYNVKYDGLELEVPSYLKGADFSIDSELIKDPEVTNLIKGNATNEEIYKILLNIFRKARKKSGAAFFSNEMIDQLNIIVQKIRNIIMGDAIYEGVFPSFSQFIGAPADFEMIGEKDWAKNKETKVESKKVNLLIGEFQPVTLGHVKAAEALKKKNGFPVVFIAIKGDTQTKSSPFSAGLTRIMLEKVQQELNKVICDVKLIPNGQIEEIMKVIMPEYEPILWGTSGRRLNDYALQMDYIKKRSIPLRLSKDFKLVELPVYAKSDEAMEAIRTENFLKFKELVPASISAQFFNLKKELE
jgi:hypothetical protein